MNPFERALTATLTHEGFFSDDPVDPGGATTFGITENVARDYGYQGPMMDFPIETAKNIYQTMYWDKNRLDEIAQYDEPIAMELFDTGVNMGIGQAAEFLQRAINVLNRNQTLYPDIKVDGVLGSKTIAVLPKIGESLEKQAIFKIINGLQCELYVRLCEKNPSMEKYVRGLLKRISYHLK